jgi:hypothetical protein
MYGIPFTIEELCNLPTPYISVFLMKCKANKETYILCVNTISQLMFVMVELRGPLSPCESK